MFDGAKAEITQAVAQLDALLASARLPAKDAARCARLADALRRPARLCLMGRSGADLAWLLNGLVGEDILDPAHLPPALELRHGAEARVTATLGDGSLFSQGGLPGSEILLRDPVFLSIEAPAGALQRMSFLTVCLEDDPRHHAPALAWAGNRSEIAIWCAGRFDEQEARIWARAPERLRHHAFLVERRSDGTPTADGDFLGRFAVPATDAVEGPAVLAALSERLNADMDEARAADIDATRLFLHRLGQKTGSTSAKAQSAPPTGRAPVDASAAGAPAPSAEVRPSSTTAHLALFSEPLLFLKRRARALSQNLLWMEEDADWAAEVLAECCETAEGLRDRAASWPEDDALAEALRRAIDEMCDTALLLQIEGGEEQAATVAALLAQMSFEFEQALAEKPARTMGTSR